MSEDRLAIAVIADTHLAPDDPDTTDRFAVLRAALEEEQPAMIIAVGDVSKDGDRKPEQLQFAKGLLDQLGVPVIALPGNHDIGNKLATGQSTVNIKAIDNWKNVYGLDRFSIDHHAWRMIGINSLIAGSNFAAEGDQLGWLDQQIAEAEKAQRHVGIFLHEPPYLRDPNERFGDQSDYWAIDRDTRARYLQRLMRPCVRLVCNGHVHSFFAGRLRQALWLWCPATYHAVEEPRFPRGGEVNGFLRLSLTETRVQYDLVPIEVPPRTIFFSAPQVNLPGRNPLALSELVLDYTGTLSKDGTLLPGVVKRLTRLSPKVRISVLTADTFGKAEKELKGLPIELHRIKTGEDKLAMVRKMKPGRVMAIGNGRNDAAMLRAAAVGVAVVGGEGAAGDAVRAADVVVNSIEDALDLLLHPLRLTATLRD